MRCYLFRISSICLNALCANLLAQNCTYSMTFHRFPIVLPLYSSVSRSPLAFYTLDNIRHLLCSSFGLQLVTTFRSICSFRGVKEFGGEKMGFWFYEFSTLFQAQLPIEYANWANVVYCSMCVFSICQMFQCSRYDYFDATVALILTQSPQQPIGLLKKLTKCTKNKYS